MIFLLIRLQKASEYVSILKVKKKIDLSKTNRNRQRVLLIAFLFGPPYRRVVV